MSAATFTSDMETAIGVNSTAVGNLDAFYLLVVGVFVFFMQVGASGLSIVCVSLLSNLPSGEGQGECDEECGGCASV